jgi:hypothetical protein
MMEAARTSETSVNVYQTTRRYNPEDSHLRTHRRENLKSYLEYALFDKMKDPLRDLIDKTGKVCSLESTKIPKVFFTPQGL